MLAPLISMNLVNQNDQEKYIAPYLEYPVALIYKGQDLACRDCFIRKVASRIVYMNDTYIFVGTKAKLKDICSPAARRYTVSSLAIDNKGDWPNLPAPQCNYAYGIKYRSFIR